ncbi:MAG TPA: flagellin [Steroidobacteraceae bacterium]|jgi:flagellin|nr:flagellin [Steroidobacteraceae bacterium]
MSLVLNTNIASLNAQNNLTSSQASLSQSLQRLSSGLRINSAADDAAGLAISQQFTTQINGTNQAVSNANDAVSEAQTTAGALNTIVNNLQSIRTLAVESANGSNSASDRQALDNQVQQQIAEITQIAQQTTFNGLNVLNGSSGNTIYQVGANVGNTITINLATGVGANQIGETATATGTALGVSANGIATTGATGALTVQVGSTQAVSVGASSNYATAVAWQDGTSAYAKAAAFNAAGASGLTATATNTVTDAGFTAVGGTATGTYGLSINGVAVFGNVTVGGGITTSAVAAQINQVSTQDGGVTASVVGGTLTLTAADGSNITLAQTLAGGATGGLAITAIPAGTTYRGAVSLTAGAQIAVAGSSAADLLAVGLTATTTSLSANSTLSQQNVQTVTGANKTIESVDSALATVSAFQSQLGAIQNRFTAAVGNLQSTAQNLTQSRSTIQDADFAAETANLTQSQVLEQAGISVLAQANQQPQLILKLLQ